MNGWLNSDNSQDRPQQNEFQLAVDTRGDKQGQVDKVCRAATKIHAVPEVRSLLHQKVEPSEKESETMKSTSVKSKSSGRIEASTPKTQLVRIELTHPTACNVCISGTFNDWHPSATDMIALGNGRWVKELTLPPGTYEYRLVVDGEWMADPQASECAPNPFGGMNSILRVLPDRGSSG